MDKHKLRSKQIVKTMLQFNNLYLSMYFFVNISTAQNLNYI